MTEIKSNITCTRCGKDILSCNCENSPRKKIEQLEKENEELKAKVSNIFNYLANDIPHELINEATNKIWKMI